MTIKLDDIDRRLLSELSEDSRQDYAQLSRKLRLSRDRIKYRMRRLEHAGVIQGYSTLINPSRFGVSLYKTYMRVYNDKARLTKLLEYLHKHPRSYWVAECYGHWDLILVIYAHTPREFQDIQDEILSKFKDIILTFRVYILVDACFFSRTYLSGMSVERFTVGGTEEWRTLNALDFRILKILSSNSRASYSEIAVALKVSPSTVRYRIERLEKEEIIASHQVDLDLSKLGRNFFKAQLYLAEYSSRKEDELRAYCRANPSIVYLIKQIGDCKLELELEVESFEQYNDILDGLREHFRGFIRNIETIGLRKQRFNGVPRDMVTANAPGRKSPRPQTSAATRS